LLTCYLAAERQPPLVTGGQRWTDCVGAVLRALQALPVALTEMLTAMVGVTQHTPPVQKGPPRMADQLSTWRPCVCCWRW